MIKVQQAVSNKFFLISIDFGNLNILKKRKAKKIIDEWLKLCLLLSFGFVLQSVRIIQLSGIGGCDKHF